MGRPGCTARPVHQRQQGLLTVRDYIPARALSIRLTTLWGASFCCMYGGLTPAAPKVAEAGRRCRVCAPMRRRRPPTTAPRSRAPCAATRRSARPARGALARGGAFERYTHSFHTYPRGHARRRRARSDRAVSRRLGVRSVLRRRHGAGRGARGRPARTAATCRRWPCASRARAVPRPTKRCSPRSARARASSPSSRATRPRRRGCRATRCCAWSSAGTRRTCCASSRRCAPGSRRRTSACARLLEAVFSSILIKVS